MPLKKIKDKGRINPGERDEEATRAFDKRQQKDAAKIEMVYKLGQRKRGGKYTRAAPGASKATDTESALNTFEVQKMFDRDQKAGKGPGIDLISDRRLARKEGSMKTGGLTGGQKKLDKNKNNRIDAEDFKILRGGRAAMKARMGSRVPQVIRPKPTAGGKPLTPKPIKPKPKPKMGGGMMKKYNKGGGADTGTMGEAKSKLATGIDAFKRRLKKEKLQGPKRPPMKPLKAKKGRSISTRGGGVDSSIFGKIRDAGPFRPIPTTPPGGFKPMGPDQSERLKKLIDRKNRREKIKDVVRKGSQLLPGVGAIGLGKRVFEKFGGQKQQPREKGERPSRRGRMGGLGGRSSKPDASRNPNPKTPKMMEAMGGGMMMKPMGYKSGTSVKVKCKLGRNKPTKMY